MTLPILIFFGILFLLVCILRVAHIGALVAFLFAGIISGPFVLNLFQLSDTWTFLGDLGILFLWFNLGLGINMRRLWEMRHTIFGFGAGQVLMVAVMLFPILAGFTTWSILGCIMVALLLAMSSTSADIQLLADNNQLNTNMGRQTFSILLFQDLLSIPLLAMLPVFAGKSFNLGATAIDIFVLSVSLILGVVVVGRFILNPVMKLVAKLKSKEAFLLAIMIMIIIGAVVLDLMGLPSGLGAFLAGMLLSETIYRHQVSAEISPYSMLFLAFFFIALGMGLNLPLLEQYWYVIAIGVVGLVIVKFSAIFIVARVRNVSVPDATMIALILAQGGEFGLLMLQTMKVAGIDALPQAHQEILTAIIIVSIMLTPILMSIVDLLRKKGWILSGYPLQSAEDKENSVKPSVVICGFGRVGQIIAEMLTAEGIPYIAIDLDVNAVMVGREHGFNVVYGNTSSDAVLRDFGLMPRRTKAVVVALDNVSTAKDTILTVRNIAPKVKIFARARNLADSKELLKEGVTEVLPETIESSFMLGQGLLTHLGIPEKKINKLLNDLRSDNYAGVGKTIADS
ncbi:MAG TPA: cation:proton antiporter [Candidatus Enterousia avicola]|uniref:Cation:proton antiporter n=1 Tax=Candidatus Enterousia avicola TaxID=2840787 RepID=A0A9D1MSJ4_9PROT|nr:cation:proton antiporter [Candidatus Enterousia avicola]